MNGYSRLITFINHTFSFFITVALSSLNVCQRIFSNGGKKRKRNKEVQCRNYSDVKVKSMTNRDIPKVFPVAKRVSLFPTFYILNQLTIKIVYVEFHLMRFVIDSFN